MTIDLGTLSDALTLNDDGIWRASKVHAVSYPEEDNAVCFQVEDGSPWFRHRNNCIASVVRRFPPSGPIIEIGAGNGYVARRLADEGFPTIVLEPGPTGAHNARVGRQIDDVICATLEDADFKTASLSAVGLFDVLEHIEDDHAVVRQLARVVRPGGLVYLSVPSPPWLFSVKDVDAQHFRRYSTAQLAALFSDAFHMEYITYMFATLTLPTLLLRALPFRLGLAKPRTSESYAAEHAPGSSSGGVMSWLFDREWRAIDAGRTRMHGTSCLLVARRRG